LLATVATAEFRIMIIGLISRVMGVINYITLGFLWKNLFLKQPII
ncbi:MAG: hypothetical protein ACD_46C00683G0001, partial [uncultured bacterium]